MKKVLLFLLIAFSNTIVFSQNSLGNKHEVKLDLLDILALRSLDFSYENHLNLESTFGVSVFVNFEEKNKDFRYNEDFQLTPYFRQFLFESGPFDFFGELFGSLNNGETDPNELNETETYWDFAMGLGFGGRRVSNTGIVIDFNVGLGRNLFDSKTSRELVPRFGISVGKQF